MSVYDHLQLYLLYLRLGLTSIPPKPHSKTLLVRWGKVWNPTRMGLETWASWPGSNWSVRCGKNTAVLDSDYEDVFHSFVTTHSLPGGCPIIKTERDFHIWVAGRVALTTTSPRRIALPFSNRVYLSQLELRLKNTLLVWR